MKFHYCYVNQVDKNISLNLMFRFIILQPKFELIVIL